ICRRLTELLRKTDASMLAAYAAMKTEPMLESLMSAWLRSGRPLVLPRFNPSSREYEMVAIHDLSTDLVAGHYGILEPRGELAGLRPPYDGDRRMMWLIPGLGFDMKGHRLGRGGGYYDRLLSGATGMKTGVGYDCQIFDAIPCESHDIGVDYVVTETRIVDVAGIMPKEG
nr:5-formyltetrahydrofolate cyclo-ligase [Lentisphaeria bacterium]